MPWSHSSPILPIIISVLSTTPWLSLHPPPPPQSVLCSPSKVHSANAADNTEKEKWKTVNIHFIGLVSWVQWLFQPLWHSQTKETNNSNWEQKNIAFWYLWLSLIVTTDRTVTLRTWSTQRSIQTLNKNSPTLELILLKLCVVYKMEELFTFNLNSYHLRQENNYSV